MQKFLRTTEADLIAMLTVTISRPMYGMMSAGENLDWRLSYASVCNKPDRSLLAQKRKERPYEPSVCTGTGTCELGPASYNRHSLAGSLAFSYPLGMGSTEHPYSTLLWLCYSTLSTVGDRCYH